MAKAKKTTTSTSKKKAEAPAPEGLTIDTSLAAETAAKMIANRAKLAEATTTGKAASPAFKQLKDSLNNPHLQSLGSILDAGGMPKKSNQPSGFGPGKQIGHNQTFGADVNRKNIPRRTSGG